MPEMRYATVNCYGTRVAGVIVREFRGIGEAEVRDHKGDLHKGKVVGDALLTRAASVHELAAQVPLLGTCRTVGETLLKTVNNYLHLHVPGRDDEHTKHSLEALEWVAGDLLADRHIQPAEALAINQVTTPITGTPFLPDSFREPDLMFTSPPCQQFIPRR